MTTKILRIGIASRHEQKARTLAIARGELKPAADDPKVWFTSIESLAQVLSSKNQLLLEIIKRAKPNSLTELAALSDREVGNLSRTLKTMARYGFVETVKDDGGKMKVRVPFDALTINQRLAAA